MHYDKVVLAAITRKNCDIYHVYMTVFNGLCTSVFEYAVFYFCVSLPLYSINECFRIF